MIKFIRMDGETVWLNPEQVVSVMECHEKLNEGSALVKTTLGETHVISGTPDAVVRKLKAKK